VYSAEPDGTRIECLIIGGHVLKLEHIYTHWVTPRLILHFLSIEKLDR
jgi:hypothetical protein